MSVKNKSKLIKCRVCGRDVAKSAKVCPNCGARLKRSALFGCLIMLILYILILFILIILIFLMSSMS